jgi:RNA 3'-terminal phosphate cyclase (ATP)
VIRIDGSYGEGGGQILRTSIALSCVTGEAVEITNIRANRPKPGLAAQHLKGIEAAKIISNAEVEGLKLGSTKVVFRPKELKGGRFRIDIGTAGSVTLILQTVLLPSLIAESKSIFEIIGGTDVSWSPPVDYLKNVTLRAVGELGGRIEVRVRERGYYPKGGGRIEVIVEPSRLEGLEYTEAECDVKGVSHCQNLPQHVAERQARAAKEFLEKHGMRAEISTEVRRGLSTGSGITVWCGYKGGSSLGERGKRAEIVGREAAERFYREYSVDGLFDSHLADQILPFAAVAHGRTVFTTTEITPHQRSNAYVIREFLGDLIELNENDRRYLIKGAGL